MSDPSSELPEVEPRDPEPVAVAIETARALFRTGERLDALRWLRRAAERAEESGDDLRAVHLARSAADLSTALQSVQPPPAPTAAPPPPPPPVAPPSARRQHDEAMALSPYDDFSDKTQVDATAPVVRDALHSGVQITELPVPDSQHSPHSVTMPSPSSNEPTVTTTHLVPPVEVAPPALRAAVRVAVTSDPASPGAWLVHPLAEGSPVPPGCEEALLVSLEPHSRLLQ
ncbi:MAG: hypothetical protein ABUL62_16475 [Myxococcales bacterium]|jgi:hypothetical protein